MPAVSETCCAAEPLCIICVSTPLQRVLRVVLGAIFLYASLSKIVYPDQFAESVLDYGLLPVQWVNLFALWLPVFELVLALSVLAGLWIRAAALGLAGLSVMFLGALVWVVSGPTSLPCACFSTDPGAEARTWWSLWQEAALVLLALSLWASHWPHTGEPLIHMRKRQALGLAVAVLLVLLLMAGIVVAHHRGGLPLAALPAQEAPVVSTGSLPRLLDLGAATCEACKQMAPALEAVERKLQGKVIVEFVDVAQNPSYAQKYEVIAIPTQLVFDASGKQVGRHEGAMTEAETLAFLKRLGVDVGR